MTTSKEEIFSSKAPFCAKRKNSKQNLKNDLTGKYFENFLFYFE